MPFSVIYGIRMRNVLIILALSMIFLSCNFFIIYLIIVIWATEMDEDTISMTFEEYLDEQWNDFLIYSAIPVDFEEGMWLEDQQLKIHVRENPHEIDDFINMQKKEKERQIKESLEPEPTWEEKQKTGPYDPNFYEDQEDESYRFGNMNSSVFETIYEACSNHWQAYDHIMIPDTLLDSTEAIETNFEKIIIKDIIPGYKNNYYNDTFKAVKFKHKQNKLIISKPKLMIEEKLDEEYDPDGEYAKMLKENNKEIRTKNAKAMRLFKQKKSYSKINYKKLVAISKLPCDKIKLNFIKNILNDEYRRVAFSLNMYNTEKENQIRKRIYTYEQRNPVKVPKKIQQVPKGILGPEWFKTGTRPWELTDVWTPEELQELRKKAQEKRNKT